MTPINKNSEPLDAVLRGAMRGRPGPETPECADANALAAYSDRSLASAERERLETHFADCMRCQVLLADIARADQQATSARAADEVPWYRRWGIAIGAIAAVAAVVVLISIRRPTNDELQRDQLVTMAKNETSAAVDLAAAKPAAVSSEPAAAPIVAAAPAPIVAAAPAHPSALAAAPAPALSAPAQASNAFAMNEAAPRAQAMGAAVPHAMARSAGAAMVAEGGAGGANVGAQGFGKFAGGFIAAPGGTSATIEARDGSVAWIVGRNGMVQRRDADGAIRVQPSGVTTDLTAGAAPSGSVCSGRGAQWHGHSHNRR